MSSCSSLEVCLDLNVFLSFCHFSPRDIQVKVVKWVKPDQIGKVIRRKTLFEISWRSRGEAMDCYSSGSIVGAIFGTLAVIALLGVLAWWIYKNYYCKGKWTFQRIHLSKIAHDCWCSKLGIDFLVDESLFNTIITNSRLLCYSHSFSFNTASIVCSLVTCSRLCSSPIFPRETRPFMTSTSRKPSQFES